MPKLGIEFLFTFTGFLLFFFSIFSLHKFLVLPLPQAYFMWFLINYLEVIHIIVTKVPAGLIYLQKHPTVVIVND